MEQLTIMGNETPEQAEAMGLHYEIVAAAQVAASSLLDLGRKLKRMRDTGKYKALGFENFGDYTERAVGIRQRQAYNYIGVVEKLPAQLIEENAAAGVTKLALLAKLGPSDQQEVAADLANITVAELQRIIDEKNGLAEQLSMLQAPREPAAEADAVELDIEQERQQAAEQARAEAKAEADRQAEEARNRHRAELDKLKAQQADAVATATAKAEAAAAEKIRQAKKEASEAAAKQVERAKQLAAEEAQRAQAEKDKTELERARQEAAEAQQRAEEVAKQLKLQNDEAGARFALLYDDMQQKANGIMDLVDEMTAAGKTEEAGKYRKALAGALRALAEQAEMEAV